MKFRRIILMALSVASLLTYSSCVKKYTCVCKFKYSGVPGLPDSTTREFEITASKSKASSQCTEESGTFKYKNITTVEECSLY